METFEPLPPIQRITGLYRNATLLKKGAIALFSDSIPKGMNIKSINKQVKGGRIYIKAFAGAKSTELNHYVLATLEEYNYGAAILHVGINDIKIKRSQRLK